MSELPFDEQQAAREKAALQYFRALEQGDEATLARILEQAQNEALLEKMLWEGHEADTLQTEAAEREQIAAQLTAALQNAFGNRVLTQPVPMEATIPDVTVADVAARLQLDAAHAGDEQSVLVRLAQLPTQDLPPRLTPRTLREFFNQAGLAVSGRFQEQFREAAVFLRMGRQQSVHLAATRRAKKKDEI